MRAPGRPLGLADQDAQLASLTGAVSDLGERVAQIEQRDPWDAVEELQRRLEPIAEAFERTRY